LEFVFTAECSEDGSIIMLTGYPQFFETIQGECNLIKQLYEHLFELSSDEYLMVSKIEDNLILAQPAIPGEEASPEDVSRFFSLTAVITVWLSKQLESIREGVPPKPFSLEETMRIMGVLDDEELEESETQE
jgi:hypothetical protein